MNTGILYWLEYSLLRSCWCDRPPTDEEDEWRPRGGTGGASSPLGSLKNRNLILIFPLTFDFLLKTWNINNNTVQPCIQPCICVVNVHSVYCTCIVSKLILINLWKRNIHVHVLQHGTDVLDHVHVYAIIMHVHVYTWLHVYDYMYMYIACTCRLPNSCHILRSCDIVYFVKWKLTKELVPVD